MKNSRRYLCFFCYLSVFALMLVFEAQRFNNFFVRESNKIPQLSQVGSFLYEFGEFSGINGFMNNVSEINTELSPKIIIDSQKPYSTQLTEIANYYNPYLDQVTDNFKQILPENFRNLLSQESDGFVRNPTQTQNIAKKTVTLAQEKSLVENSAKSEQGQVITEIAPNKASISNEVQVSESINPEKIDPVEIASREADLFTETGNKEVKLAFYNPKNSLPPPSEQSLEIYKTFLPDFGDKLKILIVGDSMMMEGLGPSLQSSLRKDISLEVIRQGRYSSGLSRPDFYNWNVNLQRLIVEHNPDLIIVSLGANDTQDIVNTKRHFIDTASWESVYSIRAMNFLDLAVSDNRKVVWVSLPVMIKLPYANRTKLVNKLQAEVCTYYENATYVNIEHLLTQDGKFVGFIKDKDNKTIRLRSKDDIHVTREGGDILADYALPYIKNDIKDLRNAEVGNEPLIPVAGKANRAVFTSKLRQKQVEYDIFLPQQADDNQKSFSAQLDLVQGNLEQKLSTQEVIAKSFDSKKFPVLYLLHGAYDDAGIWNAKLGQELQKIADEKQIIIVAPSSEEFGWYLDSPLVSSNQIESFMIKEFIPYIDFLYPSSGKRAIAGLSMGGHGALMLALKYPKMFSSSAAISGVLDLRLHQEQWKIKDLLGTYIDNEELWNNNSVNYLIQTKRPREKDATQIIIATGTEDLLVLEDNRNAKELLEKRKYKFNYAEYKGNHDWKFWTTYLPPIFREQADFLRKGF